MPISPLSRSRHAFTLVEILVVVGIIGVLTALLFTAFNAVQENGRRTVCLSNQKQLLLAVQMYTSDNASNFPYQLDTLSSSWINSLLPYVSSPQLLVCPNDGDIAEKARGGYALDAKGTKYPMAPSSYIFNGALLNTTPHKFDEDGHLVGGVRSLSSIVRPSSTILFSDGARQAFPKAPYWTSDECIAESNQNGYILYQPAGSPLHPVTGNGSMRDNSCYAPNSRHQGRTVVGFVDGHVKALEISQWYFPSTPFLDPARGG